MFNPKRLSLARKRRGMTKVALAKAIGSSVRVITAYEKEEYCPSTDTIGKISAALNFPVAFFSGPDFEEMQTDGASFRALTSMTAAQRESSLAAGCLAIELNRWIERRFNLPTPTIPSMRGLEPEIAAESLRAEWGIGERLVNMIHLLEAKGARVFSLPIESKAVDAFSIWHDGRPFVFLNNLKSGEHGRYDAAHELAHLTLHQHGTPQGRLAEIEADRFASSFLMPRGSVLACAPHDPTLGYLITLKSKWKVSLMALVRRLKTLNLLSEWRSRSLYIEIARRGYRTNEPNPTDRERSQVLAQVLACLREDGTPRTAVANALKIYVDELDSLMRGLVLSPISGGRINPNATTSSVRPEFRLVKNDETGTRS